MGPGIDEDARFIVQYGDAIAEAAKHYRGLRSVERRRAGLVSLDQKRGRKPIVTILDLREVDASKVERQ